MEYRTVVLDEAIAAAPDFSQLVILGAGLDSRAWRLPRLAGKRVFEVDHPATQSWKKSQTQGLRSQADEVHFVPVDFERDKLSECLAKAGHSPNERTFWLWEGVTMYLDREAIGATLASAASRSAPGSTLALTYFCRPFPIQAFRWIGEPFRAHFKPAELETFAGRFGWGKVSDCGQADLEALVSPKGPFANTALWRKATHRWAVERIWVGRHGQAGPSKPTR
jgi:methyltransferase (TIGR00027 family)